MGFAQLLQLKSLEGLQEKEPLPETFKVMLPPMQMKAVPETETVGTVSMVTETTSPVTPQLFVTVTE